MPAPVILVALILASPPAEALSAGEKSIVAVRPPHELRKAIHESLQRTAASNNPNPYAAAPSLIALFEELRRDTKIEEFDRRRLSGLLRARLQLLSKSIENDLAAPGKHRPPSVQPRSDVLAQQGLPAGVARSRAGAGGSPNGSLRDNGQALVDLIKRTIAPTTWDDVGGPGSIYYYRPLRVLVIRQTGDVHEQIGGALGGLRRP